MLNWRMAFDQVISLGHRCYTWMQFRRLLLQTVGMPFDSIVASADKTAEAIRSKFSGSLQPENLFVSEEFVLDAKYNFEHWHDFHDKRNPYLDLEAAQQKRAFVVDRFYKLLRSPRRLLFVRHETPGSGSLHDIKNIMGAIAEHRPAGSSHFLYLSDNIESGASDGLTMMQTPKAMILDDDVWDNAMAAIHNDERISGYYPRLVSAYQAWPKPLQMQTLKLIGTARKRATQIKLMAT